MPGKKEPVKSTSTYRIKTTSILYSLPTQPLSGSQTMTPPPPCPTVLVRVLILSQRAIGVTKVGTKSHMQIHIQLYMDGAGSKLQ